AKTRIKEAFNKAQGQEMTELLERLGTVEDRADLSEWMKESHSIEDLRDMARKQGAIEVESLNRSQLARLLHAAKNGWVGFEIKVGEVKGELVVLEMNGKKANISGATNIDKATVLRMKPGHSAILGKALPCEHVAFVGEFKNGTWKSRPAFAGQLVPGRAPKPTVAQPRPRRPGRLPKPMVHALGQTGLFAGGYLLKETFYGIKDRDPARIKQGFKTVSSPMFAGSLGVFMGLQLATDKAMMSLRGSTRMAKFGKAFTRFALPLYAGTAILAVASGHSSAHDVMVDATAFGLSMLAFAPLDIAMAPLLAMGPPGWVAFGAVKVVQIALMLDLAERLRPVLDPLVRSAEKKVGKGLKWAKKKAKGGLSWAKKKAKGGASWTKKKAKGGASWTKKKAKGGASWLKKKAKGGASWTKKKSSSALSTGKSGAKSFWKDIKKRSGAVKKGTKSGVKKGWKKLKKSGSKVKKGLKKLKFW
ncbi:MAG: hypothetical protein QF645_09050, partial [Planctomycetota bacterium]|nr:hypothetical protein [Planctomycetota bacterium]